MGASDRTSEQKQLADLKDRLARRFPSADPQFVHTVMMSEYEAFDSARVRDFVAVLTERNVVKRLAAAGSSPVR